VLYGDRPSIPVMRTTEQGLMAGLSRGPPEEVEIFSEYLDLSRFPAVLYIPMLRDGAGNSVSPFEVARQLAQASRVLVYGLSGPQQELTQTR
jgi:hypothetical protein